MTASRLVNPARIRPNTKIADLEDIVEANTERCLEGEDVQIETVHCSVNVPSDTDDHRAPLPSLAQSVHFDFPRRDLPLTHRIEIVGSVKAFALSQLAVHHPGDMPPQYNVVA